MNLNKAMEGPVGKSTNSVFDTLNKKTEALDILNKYKTANEELVRASVENIQILGMTEPVKLADMYSTTRVSTTIHRRLFETEWTKVKSKSIVVNNSKNKTTQRADEFIENHNRIVVLAGPGSGKTTLLKYTALSYIDSELFSKSALNIKKVPFFVSLPELVNTEFNIGEYLSDRIKLKTHEYSSYYIHRTLDKGRGAILLDSLDEVPLSKRQLAYERISQISKLYPKSKIIITCRVADYDRTLEGFYEVEISRLTKKSINKIIKAWFKGKPKKANELINHLKVDDDVLSLTETPLLLSLLCIQYANDLNIPNRKTELYSRCIDALLRLWDTSRGFRRGSAFSSLTDDRKEKLFSDVAFYFSCHKGGQYIFPEDETIGVIGDFVERFGLSRALSLEILTEIESHHGILEKYSAESYTFSHVSFQEYFVACALVSKHVELQYVKSNVSNTRAASIIIFMVALMDDPTPILKFIMDKSNLKGIKTYPAMSSRTEILNLLYRCMNSGVSIIPKLRKEIYMHIATSQIEISKIYREAKTFPIARLEDDGVSHTFFYMEKTRRTLGAALISYRKLANEILLSPNEKYAEIAIDVVSEIPHSNHDFLNLCVKGCMLVPLAGAKPLEVLKQLEEINDSMKSDSTFHRLGLRTTEKIRSQYIDSTDL